MKICVVDDSYFNFGDLNWDCLLPYGESEVYHDHPASFAALVERMRDADIVVADKPDMRNAAIFDACPKLKYVTLTATGYDTIDLAAARAHGIAISNVPSYGTQSVSQYAIALLMEVCCHAAHYSARVHSGHWHDCGQETVGEHRLIELAGKTMGIIGFGRIGRAVGAVARALGMTVIAYNRSRCPEGEAIGEYVTLDELYARSDVISLHCPATEATTGIINADSIAKMKDGVIIINNGRGVLIRSQDLADALHSGKVWAAGLDVVDREPILPDNPLLTAPRCVITPHVSWLPKESRQRIVDCTADNIRSFLAGNPQNVVN